MLSAVCNRTATHAALTASSTGTQLTTGVGADTLGTYVELISATTIPCQGIEVMLFTPALAENYIVNLAIGSGGSEQTIIPGIHCGNGRTSSACYSAYFPLRLPAGVRISAACQDTTGAGTNTVRIAIKLHGASQYPAGNRVVAYGVSGSTGTTVDPGGTANTLGSWVQLTAATTCNHRGLILCYGGNTNTVMTAATWLVNVAIGAGGSEQTIISNIGAGAEATYDGYTQLYTPPMPICIPVGSRIAVQAQCSINDATDRLLRVIAYGVG